MYVSLDVYISLDVRKSCGRASLQRMGDYVLANYLDRKEFDKFRDSSFYQKGPLVATDLLTEFMKIQNLPIQYIHEHGKYYISNFPNECFHDLCQWARIILHGPNSSGNYDILQ